MGHSESAAKIFFYGNSFDYRVFAEWRDLGGLKINIIDFSALSRQTGTPLEMTGMT